MDRGKSGADPQSVFTLAWAQGFINRRACTSAADAAPSPAYHAICGKFAQARAYIARGNTKMRSNILRSESVWGRFQYVDNAFGKVRHAKLPILDTLVHLQTEI
jgi:hypothetical protein